MHPHKNFTLQVQLGLGVAGVLTLMSLTPSLTLRSVAFEPSQIQQPTLNQLQQAEALNNQGVELANQGEYAAAIRLFNQAIAIYPHYEKAYSNLGIALGSQGQLTEAIAAFNEALKIDPNNWETYNNLGIAWGMQEEIPNAIAAFERAIQINPGEPISYRNLGIAYVKQRQLPRAIAILEQAQALYQDQNNASEVDQIEQVLARLRQAIKASE
ncbi:tetratricopeptide repeat protein [Oscillatoria amoena NRMC-F 0135]|nr:tetratricopeptide repeat protein [Geitlerinema splendidum]MDL5044695.1 tetratricopeptide repeat protein [Oscillatoria amoena NRMC-F 0135]